MAEASISTLLEFRKRNVVSPNMDLVELKRRRQNFYRLESESSKASEEDTESITSLQGRETDVVRDTSDTDTKSECSSAESHILEVEYEVASLSDDGHPFDDDFTSSGTEDVLATAGAIAAAIYDTSVEAWITDVEESDNSSSLEDDSFARTEYWTCIQCKSENNNPCFRFCEKCFQERKNFFPPRPRKNKKIKKELPEAPVKLDTLRSCLNGLASQDSGIGSSQEFSLGSSQEFPALDLGQIVVPKCFSEPMSSLASTSKTFDNDNTEKRPEEYESNTKKSTVSIEINRKRQWSESSISDFEEPKRIKLRRLNGIKNKKDIKTPTNESENETETEEAIKISKNETATENVTKKSENETANEKSENETATENAMKKSENETETESAIKKPENETEVETNIRSSLPEYKELCIICNVNPKNSIFLHGSTAHMCSCYKCAQRTWLTNKRCPVCNRKVKNVVKVFTI